MFSAEEIIAAAQLDDLKKEEERIKREKAEAAAWLAKAKAPGTYNASQLLEKITGSGAEGAALLQAPAVAKTVVTERKNDDARFPPPPTSK